VTETLTEHSARAALACASTALRQAGVTGVWIYMDGAGWSESYTIGIAETDPVVEMVTPVFPEGLDPVPVTRLRREAKDAVAAALSGLDPGERIALFYASRDDFVRTGERRVWPAREIMRPIQKRIAKLERELDELRKLDAATNGK